jgi:hypothetical protein
MDINRKIVVLVWYLRVADNNYWALILTTQKWNRLVRGMIEP